MDARVTRGLLFGAAVLAVGVSACGDDTAGTDAHPGEQSAPEGVVHVHGLGVNPASGDLYVASHYGLFHLEGDGEPERVGPIQDLMGFAVVGEDHFVASGHPGMEMAREGTENPLGLIESTDGGKTWETVSLSGEVDFHAMTYAHDNIYGWNASGGELLVSQDGEEWDERAQTMVGSLAVDPDDPERLVATTPDGLSVSSDGGATWDAAEEEGVDSDLMWLSWDASSGLWAAAVDGALYRTDDPESGAWEKLGMAEGRPMALHVYEGDVYLSLDDAGMTTILASTDGTATWEQLYHGT